MFFSEEEDIWDIESGKEEDITILPKWIGDISIAQDFPLSYEDDYTPIRKIFSEDVALLACDHRRYDNKKG